MNKNYQFPSGFDMSKLLDYGFKHDEEYGGYYKDVFSKSQKGMFVPFIRLGTLYTYRGELRFDTNQPDFILNRELDLVQQEFDVLLKDYIIKEIKNED